MLARSVARLLTIDHRSNNLLRSSRKTWQSSRAYACYLGLPCMVCPAVHHEPIFPGAVALDFCPRTMHKYSCLSWMFVQFRSNSSLIANQACSPIVVFPAPQRSCAHALLLPALFLPIRGRASARTIRRLFAKNLGSGHKSG